MKPYFDGVALHPYVADAKAMGAQLDNLRRIMRVHGDGATPLYVTELGWGSDSGPTRWERGLCGQAEPALQGLLDALRQPAALARRRRLVVHLDRRRRHLQSSATRPGLLTANREAKPAWYRFNEWTGGDAGTRAADRQRRARTRRRSRKPPQGEVAARRIARLRSDFQTEQRSIPMAFSVPDLPYAYDALEPHIDEATMRVHHDKHHQAYVDKANAALEGTEWADRDVEDVLRNLSSLPGDKQAPVRNNAGGHYNHSLFWQMMSPDGGGEPSGDLGAAIDRDLRLLRRLQGRVQKRRHRPLRLRLGLAGQGLLRPRRRLDPEPGLADLRRQHAAARRRRLGARLLPQVPEQAPGLPRRLLERRQLGLRRGAASPVS